VVVSGATWITAPTREVWGTGRQVALTELPFSLRPEAKEAGNTNTCFETLNLKSKH